MQDLVEKREFLEGFISVFLADVFDNKSDRLLTKNQCVKYLTLNKFKYLQSILEENQKMLAIGK
jgi:hypothetical protein